jgi:uncharacterized protein RhaS with RHS repeats
VTYYRARYYNSSLGRFLSEDPIVFDGGSNFYIYVENDPVAYDDPDGLARCFMSISRGQLICLPDSVKNHYVSIQVASGNNGKGKTCKNNPDCSHMPDRGPIPLGHWHWTRGYTSKPNGRVLAPSGPLPFVVTYGRDLIRSHSCSNPFGPSLGPKFCSEGCVTGTEEDIQHLNVLLDAEPGSTLYVGR